jgi:hypothetical protein
MRSLHVSTYETQILRQSVCYAKDGLAKHIYVSGSNLQEACGGVSKKSHEENEEVQAFGEAEVEAYLCSSSVLSFQ